MVSKSGDQSWFWHDHEGRMDEREKIANGQKGQLGMANMMPSTTLDMPVRQQLLDAAATLRQIISPLSQPNDTGLDITRFIPTRSRLGYVFEDGNPNARKALAIRPLDALMEQLGKEQGDTPDVPDEIIHRDAAHPDSTESTAKKPLTWLLNWARKLWR